jgi:HAD superfamily hydrolase (TIGR01484 family)
MKYKALILDVDGTLIAEKDTMPSKKVIEAIKKLQKKKNIHISLATARPFREIKELSEVLDLSDYSIVSGGAQLVHIPTEKYHYEYPIDAMQAIDLAKQIHTLPYESHIWIQDNGFNYEFGEKYTSNKPFTIVISGLTMHVVDKIIETIPPAENVAYTKVFSRKKGKFEIHVSDKRATKKHGIETLAALWKIKQNEIIGVGDGYNDYALLQSSGLKIAMGNAVDQLKDIADFVAPSVEDDGLIVAINKYF